MNHSTPHKMYELCQKNHPEKVSQCRSCNYACLTTGCQYTKIEDPIGSGMYKLMPFNCTACIQSKQQYIDQTQKKIQNTVRVSATEYMMNKESLAVFEPLVTIDPKIAENPRFISQYSIPSSLSDRRIQHIVKASEAIPRHPNSKHRSRTSLRPGGTSAAGKGVDVKHGSYARYLARKKGQASLRAGPHAQIGQASERKPSLEEIKLNPKLTTGGKNVKFSIVANAWCCPLPSQLPLV